MNPKKCQKVSVKLNKKFRVIGPLSQYKLTIPILDSFYVKIHESTYFMRSLGVLQKPFKT